MTFCELREKDIINIRDCKRLGRVSDLIFDPKNGCILSLITSAGDKLLGHPRKRFRMRNSLVQNQADRSRHYSCGRRHRKKTPPGKS